MYVCGCGRGLGGIDDIDQSISVTSSPCLYGKVTGIIQSPASLLLTLSRLGKNEIRTPSVHGGTYKRLC